MTIEKGQDWGSPGTLSPASFVAATDAEAALRVGTSEPIGVADGDLARTLGVRTPFVSSRVQQLLPVDAIELYLDDDPVRFAVAHAIVGRLHRDQHVHALMNAAFVGHLNLAPRSHPGDGKIDVVTLDLGFADRVKARQRMATGIHIPHPGISVRRRVEGTIEVDRPKPVTVDGDRVGRFRRVRYTVVTNALTIGV